MEAEVSSETLLRMDLQYEITSQEEVNFNNHCAKNL